MSVLSRLACVSLSTLLYSGIAYASTGLAEYEKPWELCGLCHSLDGNSPMAKFPKLAGQPQAYIEKQLDDFLQGRRTNDGGQMSAIVTEIKQSDFKAIAGWFSSQPHPLPVFEAEITDSTNAASSVVQGKVVFEQSGCAQCHSAANSTDAESAIPLLKAQHAQYLSKQLADFRAGVRTHVPNSVENDPINSFAHTDLDNLVSYLAGSRRE